MDNAFSPKDRPRGIVFRIPVILSVFYILWTVSGCSPASSKGETATLIESPFTAALSPTPTATGARVPSQNPTWPQTLTDTSAGTPTQTPTATISPSLKPIGPFYVWDGSTNPSESLIFKDFSGTTQWTVNLPQVESGKNSPDHKWYAYVTGSVNGSGIYPEGGVVLHLLNYLSGEVKDIANLVPEDYFTRQERVVKQSDSSYICRVDGPNYPDCREPEYCISHSAECLGVAMLSLNASIDSLDWSPDGKYLAFGAILNGDSADLYVYDIDTGKIRRMEKDPGNAQSFYWSPDGQWIIYENIDLFFRDIDSRIYPDTRWAVRRDGTGGKEIPGPVNFYSWFSDDEYVAYRFLPLSVITDATLVNIQTGYAFDCFPSEFSDFIVDSRSRMVAVNDGTAIYFGPVYSELNRTLDIIATYKEEYGHYYWIGLRGGTIHPFVGEEDGRWFGITPAGKIDPLNWTGDWYWYRRSPRNWLALYSENEFRVYDPSDRLRFELHDIPSVVDILWDTNSQGLFYFSSSDAGRGIFYWKLGDTTPRLVVSIPASYKQASLSIAPIINLKSLPYLRILPTRAAKPAEGTSIWSQTKYRELTQPGTNRYDVTIPADSSWRWSFSLGTTDTKLFDKILAPEDVEFLINGEKIDPNMIQMSDQTAEGRFTRTWATMLSGWRSGDKAELEIHYTLHSAVTDGNLTYPAGEYRQVISLGVE